MERRSSRASIQLALLWSSFDGPAAPRPLTRRPFARLLVAELRPGRAGANDPVRPPQQRRSPGQPRREGFAELVAAKSGGKMKVQEYPASQLGNELQQQSALQGGVQEMSAPATTSLAGIVKEFGLIDFPFLGLQLRPGRCAPRRPARPGADRQAAGEGPGRARLLGPRLSQRHQQQAPDRPARGSRRPEDPRHSEPGVPRHLQGVQGEPGADAVHRALRRARVEGGRRPGKSVRGDPVEQVLRGAEVRQRDQPRLRGEHRPRQQEVLGPALARGAEDHERRRERDARLPAPGEPRRRAEGGERAAGQGHGVQRRRARRAGAHAADRQALVDKFIASYDPAIAKLYNDELARIHKAEPQNRDRQSGACI